MYESAGALLGDSTPEAADRLQWVIATAFTALQLESIVHTLGTRSLLSRFSLYSNVQAPLPDDQWQREVELWHDTVLAFMQESFVAAARGQSDDAKLGKLFMEPDSAEAKRVCANQKIRSTAYVSFSFLGLVLILAVGALVILVALTLEPLVGCVQRRWGKAPRHLYARLEWTATETLQLQRMAHEELGYGGKWRGAAEAVPVTAPGELLGLLDTGDVGHPRLVERGKQEGEEEKEEAVRVDVERRLGSPFSGASGETLGSEGSGEESGGGRRDG